jgi:hypothetical protein
MVGKVMHLAGRNLLPYLKKSGSIIAIDGPAHGLSSGKEFSIPKYAEFIHIAVENSNLSI